MAVLRADGAFITISTVGAPPQGVVCPSVTHTFCAFLTPYQYYTLLQIFMQQLRVIYGEV